MFMQATPSRSSREYHTVRTLCLSLGILFLGGCSWFSWLPWVEGEDDKTDSTEPLELVKFEREVDIDRDWKASVGQGLGRKYLRLNPALVADRIIAADGYGQVEARDRFSGKSIWKTKVRDLDKGFLARLNFLDRTDPSFVSGGIGVGGGLTLLGTTFGEVIALHVADGSEAWRVELGSEILSTPVVAEGLVFAQTIDGRLVALDEESGELQWSFDNQVPILTLRGTSSPVVRDRIVYAGFSSGKLIALRAENGEPIWEHRVMLPEGRSELERMVDVDGRALVTNAVIYVGAFQGRVKSISRRDGRPRWEQKISTFLDLAEGYEQLYVIDAQDVITAIDQQTGDVVWTQENFKRRKLTAPVAFSNYIAFGDDEGYLHIIAQRDGRLMGRRKLDGDGLRSGFAYQDGTLYVLGNSGSLHALKLQLK